MNKKILYTIIFVVVLSIGIFLITRFSGSKENLTNNDKNQSQNQNQEQIQAKSQNTEQTLSTSEEQTQNNIQENNEVSKKEQAGTAGSNIPLKDDLEEAEFQIKAAMRNLFEEKYGREVIDSKINVTKIYSEDEESEIKFLKDKKLGLNEVAFEVSYELKIADSVDNTTKYTEESGIFDEDSRWVTKINSVGILKQNGDEYIITDFMQKW